MAMEDDIIANYIQSPKTLESFYQLSPIASPPTSIDRQNTFYKSAENILFNNITFWDSILIAEHSKQSVW